MRFYHAALIALGLGMALPVSAETAPEAPLWAYLAECSAVFEAASKADESYTGAEQEEIARAVEVARLFLAEAVEEAGAAGQADPGGDVASIMGYLRERWQNRTAQLFSIPSNLKWIRYCAQLARQRGILPLAE